MKHLTRIALTSLAALMLAALFAVTPASAAQIEERHAPIVQADFDFGIVLPLNFAPVYNNYFTCVGSWVYADFTDWNDDDADLNVTMISVHNGQVQVDNLEVSDGYHGVFFYEDTSRPTAGTWFAIKATDPHGASSPWIFPTC